MLKVYGFSRVNEGARGNTRDLRVLWTLEEMGMAYEIVGMDHPNPRLPGALYGSPGLEADIPSVLRACRSRLRPAERAVLESDDR